jgi:Ca2+-transporting ATPase
LQKSSLLCADEAILTGESVPVNKNCGDIYDKDNTLNKSNIVYSGTNITKGSCNAEVIATGSNAQIGKISSMLNEIQEEQTPLQKRLGELGKVVGIICIATCFIVFGAGVLHGFDIFQMLMTGITIAIAAIPEGLPATVTIALALAVNRMLKQKALVNRLHSVETLGCTSIICSDKTGTITENRMTVKTVFAGNSEYIVTGNGYRKDGSILQLTGENTVKINPKSSKELTALLECCVVCETATVSETNSRNRGTLAEEGEFDVTGDPTEIALLIVAAKGGITAERLSSKYVKIDELPFDSENKYMSVTVETPSKEKITFTKGAVEVVAKMCSLTVAEKKHIQQLVSKYANESLRVLAFAKNNVFLGLIGMLDPPREDAIEAIKLCQKSKIKVVMITGDHKETAVAIAKQTGIIKNFTKDAVITGAELDRLSDTELAEKINNFCVYARVNPSHKLRLVKIYKQKGNIVTMTGDGVNDAPAIKEADIGVSMGITGTDVAKEAADVVLLDDNFATLVKSVEQGRAIYANIRKFVRYLLSCNIGEVLTMFIGILMGFPIVLLPVQILLVNLVTDGLPALALSLEPPENETMRKAPRKANESFFSNGLLFNIVFRGIMIGLCTLGCFTTVLRLGFSLETARTCGLLTLVLSQFIHVFECKSETGNVFTVKYFNNLYLVFAVLISAAVIFAAIYFPPLQLIFTMAELSQKQVLISLGFAVVIPIVNCFIKN